MSAETENRVALLLCERHQSASPTRQPCAACVQDARTALVEDSMTLSDFLLARIAEDEKAATAWLDVQRKLAECQAKRGIVELALDAVEDQGGVNEDSGGAFSAAYDHVCQVLATVYADHPDYQQEWRP